jgi:hypothetical protein
MNPARLIRAPLLPGRLTSGQQNRLSLLLHTRAGIGLHLLWEMFAAADRHAVCALSLNATDEKLETRAADVARDTGLSLATAALLIGAAIGLRLGLD